MKRKTRILTCVITACALSFLLIQPVFSKADQSKKWIPQVYAASKKSNRLEEACWTIKDGQYSVPAYAVSDKFPGLEIKLPSHEPQKTWLEDWRSCPNNKKVKLLVWGAETGKKGKVYKQQFITVVNVKDKKMLGHFIVRAYWEGKDDPEGEQFNTPLLFLPGKIKACDQDLFYDDFDKETYKQELVL